MSNKELVTKKWNEAKEKFNYPFVSDVLLEEEVGRHGDTASFDWKDRKVRIVEPFLEYLAKKLGSKEDAIEFILDHEVGHWVLFPREVFKHLYLLSEGHQWFGEKTESIYAWYADLANEGALLATGLGSKNVLDSRIAFIEEETEKRAELLAMGGEADDASMNKMLAAMYIIKFKEFNDYELPEFTPKEEEVYEELQKIPFVNLPIEDCLVSFYLFGKAVQDLIPELPKQGGSRGEGEDGEGGSMPGFPGKDGSIDDIPQKELDKALSDILGELGPKAYKKAMKYLQKRRPDFTDMHGQQQSKGNQAGLGWGNFTLNDELIPLYRRWSAQYGLYIVKRPVEADSSSQHRCGTKEYEMGDPLQKADIFGSKGMIGVPGISKTYVEEEGTIPMEEWRVPDLNIGIDTSGSMEHPGSRDGAAAVLAAFILAKNYSASGARVGGWNFSTDIAFTSPRYDMEDFYSVMCGWWGGGTYINTHKLTDFLQEMKFDERGIKFSDETISEDDTQRYVSLLPEDKQKEMMDKSLDMKMEQLKVKCDKLDNVLITDGYLSNISETLHYLRGLGEYTRNFIFITEKRSYEEWVEVAKDVPNTYVYLAESAEDLVGLAVGRAESLQDDSGTNFLEGYE